MNWIMGSAYLLFSILLYWTMGYCVLKRCGYQDLQTAKTIIVGFLLNLCLQWLVGFPCQLFHVSWYVYFYILIVIYILIISYLYVIRNTLVTDLKEGLRVHLANFWFVYTTAIVFSLFSMASSFAYFDMNYDDPFYIGSIVQEIGAPQLAVTNFFNGSYETVGLERILNTFGLSYGFWSEIFNIDVTFFAKGVMAIHNYTIIFLSYLAFFRPLFKGKEKLFQFAIIIFLMLLIPAGYLAQNNIIRMYDGWQFNTAIWYGSSIIRVAGLPILLMLGHDILKEFKIQRILLYGIACIALLSLSTVAVTFGLLTSSWLMLLLLYKLLKKKNFKLWKIILVIVILALIIVFGLPALCRTFFPNFEQALEIGSLPGFRGYRFTYLNASLLLMICVSIVCVYAVIRRKSAFTFYVVELGFLLLLVMSGSFDEFILAISFNYNFVGLRLTTSVQLLSMGLAGYCLFDLLVTYVKKEAIVNIVAISSIISVCLFNRLHMTEYRGVSIESSGLSDSGFSFSRIIKNTNLMPTIYDDISSYFNELNDGKHRVISVGEIPYENSVLQINKGLIMSTRHIEVCTVLNEGCKDVPEETKERFAAYAYGVLSDDVLKELKDYRIEYVVTPYKNLVEFQNFEVVLESVSEVGEVIYLIKI